ncbi:hypothetical protein BEWA_023720 [Theileria equi strain WA]|uniref:Uncharacterized protein n=1 Tax=Theileria equi strain WA TaxID=1537102 RepID=L0AWA9_THEEQ|nr:hypothetical protein BEWA_023720 [Theileria equi strain WA]AFZ79523.1 hypothetical protein BEWA_023720 [Theileria equi strain WA]|eukprot:XP_004829189.1 hypothetical protein BEWA_023720 [Theileria equi strain WA]
MGQGQSINPEELQEDYYIFFDKNKGDTYKSEKNTYTRLVNYKRAFGTKYIHRQNEVDIANLSTNFSVDAHGSYKPSIDSSIPYDKQSIYSETHSYKHSIDSAYENLTSGTRTLGSIDNLQVNAQSPKLSLSDLEIAGSILDNGKKYALDEYGSILNKPFWRKDSISQNESDEALPHEDVVYTEFEGPDGNVYSGFSRSGKLFKGSIKSIDGQYTGGICDNKPHGYGIYTRDRSEYRGMWKNGLQHGEGVYLDLDDPNFKRGVWCNGKLTRWKGHNVHTSTLLKEIMTDPLSPDSLVSSAYTSFDVSPTNASPINWSSTGGQI